MRVGFHLYNRFYYPQLAPVYNLLKKCHPCLLTEKLGEILAFKPRILLVADNRYYLYRSRLPGTIVIWVRHGFVSKNVLERSIRGCDFACLSGPWLEQEYLARGWKPRSGYWHTGFVSMDEVLAPGPKMLPADVPDNFKQGGKTLLYAPTWNRYFNSVELLKPGWISRLRGAMPDLNVIIKPHPYIPRLFPGAFRAWKKEARLVPRVHVVEKYDDSIYPYFHAADALLADASSVIFYFLALNRPIVLMNNPRRFLDRNFYDPEGPEWAWRDMGYEIESETELAPALQRALQHPEEKAGRRMFYRERIFGDRLDGRSAERIADKVRSLIAPGPQDAGWVAAAWNNARVFGESDREARSQAGIFRQFLKLGFILEKYPALKYRLNQIRKRWLHGVE